MAEDLVQEGLARALSLAATYDSSRSLLPWLIAIIRNTYLAGLTRETAERRRVSDLAMLAESSEPPAQEHGADLMRVQRAMEALPAEQAEVLHLVGVLGFTYSDAGRILGIPSGTVMSRLSRARSALRQALEMPLVRETGLRVVGGQE